MSFDYFLTLRLFPITTRLKNFDMSYQISTECKLCGKCKKVCPSNAIIMKDKQYVIISEKCESCGVCAAQCPREAIVFSEATANFESQHPTIHLSVCGQHDSACFHHACRKHRHWSPRRCRQEED